jgi:hypothetical protein
MRRPCWTQIHEKRFRAKWYSGSREENALNKKKRFRAKWYSGSREENASNNKKRFESLKWFA